MYVIIREGKQDHAEYYSERNPQYRETFGETQEKLAKVHPRDLSPLRRLAIKKMRFQGRRADLVAEAAAIRDLMTKEINR